jgi:hypothetical protein
MCTNENSENKNLKNPKHCKNKHESNSELHVGNKCVEKLLKANLCESHSPSRVIKATGSDNVLGPHPLLVDM